MLEKQEAVDLAIKIAKEAGWSKLKIMTCYNFSLHGKDPETGKYDFVPVELYRETVGNLLKDKKL